MDSRVSFHSGPHPPYGVGPETKRQSRRVANDSATGTYKSTERPCPPVRGRNVILANETWDSLPHLYAGGSSGELAETDPTTAHITGAEVPHSGSGEIMASPSATLLQ